PHAIGCDGLVDEVRISNAAQPIDTVPEGPRVADEQTVGLWHFDDVSFEDASRLKNPARVSLPQLENSSCQAADPELKLVLLDRSARESFLSVRADSEGRLFAGGREALFAYEPDPAGGYRPRRELYRFPPHSWITDIEIRGNDLYVMTASAIYLFPEARTALAPVEPKRLIWGLPLDLHVTMHGLAWGPEGDLYFAAGDPLLNYGDFERADHWGHWTIYSQPEGSETPYTGAGGVFRCRPDGSGLEVLARGTRGSDGLAFDRHWNLFTNDNDHESLAHRYSPARLLHVTPHADFHWPRGWMPSITPERAELLEPVYDGMVRGVPVGQAYYDDPFFPAEYRNNLLVARWDLRSVTRYPLVPRGASLSAGEHQLLSGQGNARPVGVAVGRGGRVFAAISYMAQNEGSPTYPSDLVMITTDDDAPGSPFEACDVTLADEALLWRELSHDAWSRRLAAHQEILRRGGDVLAETSARLKNLTPDDPAWLHLPWLSAASNTSEAAGLLTGLAEHPRPEIRLQAVRALTEMWQRADRAGDKAGASADDQDARRKVVVRALSDPSPPVQLAALAACFSLDGPVPDEVASAAARSSDSYLRQTATTLLAQRAGIDRLASLCRAPDLPGRLAGVLAAGCRLTVPPATGPVPAELELKYFSPNALFVIDYADARIDLRDGRRVGSFTIAEYWKTIPHTVEQERIFELLLAMLDDPAEAVRLQAAHFLYLLNDPRSESLIPRARSRGTLERLATAPYQAIDALWLIGPFDPVTGTAAAAAARVGPVEEGPVDLSARYEIGGRTLEWQKAASEKGQYDLAPLLARSGSGPGGVCYVYCRLESPRPEACMLVVESDGEASVWHNGRPADSADALLLKLEPGSNDLLVRLNGTAGKLTLGHRADGDVRVTLPEKLGLETLAERLKSATGDASQTIAAEFLEVDWSKAASQGDWGRGRRLFGGDALGCVKCHAVTAQQSAAGGPSLADAARRFTVDHLVESILLPSKQVAPLFRATSVETDDGLPVTGLVVRETDDELELLLPDATRKVLDKRRIEARALQELSPMPSGVVKTPQELADVLAYLLSDNPVPP
ncbi:MAG: hypothetical protein WD278_11490, partial [Pirellulales bacterium]